MKYFQYKNSDIKALVALKAIKGESISYLSATYHVNRKDIVMWKRQLVEEMHLEDWMVKVFSKQPHFIANKERGSGNHSEDY